MARSNTESPEAAERPETSATRPPLSFWGWIGLGLFIGVLTLIAQTKSVGDDAAQLLAAGDGRVAEAVAQEFPGVAWDPGFTHDGHRYYAMALDPWGRSIPELSKDPIYWYQRIAYPAISGAFGLLSGRSLLWSMIAIVVAGFAWTVGVTHLLSRELGLNWLSPMASLVNVGGLLGVSLLTSDPLAVALFFTGVWLWMKTRHPQAGVVLAISILTKEVFAAPVLVLALYQLMKHRKRSAVPYLVALVPAISWRLLLLARFGLDTGDGGSIGLPGAGIAQAWETWAFNGPRDIAFLTVALLALVAGIATIWHPRKLWAWLALPWVAIGLVGSHWVWDFGNNAVRVISPLITIVILAAFDMFSSKTQVINQPASP